MKKITNYLIIILLSFSCNSNTNNKEINITFNEKINIDDFLKQDEYKKLNMDEEYKDYLNDFYENLVQVNAIGYTGTEFLAEEKFNSTSKKSDTNIDYIFSAFKDISSIAKDGYDVMRLEKRNYINHFQKKKYY